MAVVRTRPKSMRGGVGSKARDSFSLHPSAFAEVAINIASAGGTVPFSFEGRSYLRKIYDTPAKKVLLKCARQCEKSTSLGNRILAYSCIVPNFKSLYVSPSQMQTTEFSKERIGDTIAVSPRLQAYTTGRLNNSIFHKKFINHSQVKFRFCFLSAARIRGIPADLIAIDEIQDIIFENVPIIEQCASHSDYKLYYYSGTPLTLDNTIEYYWSNFSTQNAWVVPCRKHGTNRPETWHWNVLGERNIGTYGPICDRCGAAIDPADPDASWASMQRPDPKDPASPVVFEGFRTPQIMVPWKLTEEGWQEVLLDQRRHGRKQFFNECLGLSYDSGDRPITRGQLKACCDDTGQVVFANLEKFRQLAQRQPVFAGIDHGTGENSYTVIALCTYIGGKLVFFHFHRFTGKELELPIQLDAISQYLVNFNIQVCGVDYGGGFDRNEALIRRFGPKKILKYQYTDQLKGVIRYDNKLGRFMVHRTEVMSDLFAAIRYKKVLFPAWQEFQNPYGDDFLNIFSEYSEQRRMIKYDRAPGCTDDSFHAYLYAWLASMVVHPRPDILAPTKEGRR